ncbi:MAG: PD-(D/E)XK nuclease-like domain-containing protein [Sodalis sp. (in: enterobacteria)]|uniref:PD-(D/E)XK nuclease-like domain-containing protein n=1 Tax=Sodalis sp. (in: enterobacteria) TaxID=1898979 RepID=UPI0039E38E4D
MDIARALWEGELHWEAIPSEVEQWARKLVKRCDGNMRRWYLALREVPNVLSRSREFIFMVIRSPHDPEIYLTPEAIDAYVASFVEPEAVDEDSVSDEIAETPPMLERDAQRLAKFLAPEAVDLPESPDADDEWVPGLPEDEPETSVASETADVPAIAELETLNTEDVESEIQYSPETDMPAFLRDLKPMNLRSNEGKERLAAFEATCAERGIMPLKRDDFDTVCLMRDSALAYPTVASLLENVLLLKVRPDWLDEFAGAPFLLDIKTTDDVLDFGKSVEKFGYHLQAAFYEFVMEKVFGLGVDFAFCAISKRQECGRYPVLLGILDEEDGYTGRQLIETTLFHLATGNRHPASGLATFSRQWWAKQADRKRREAQEVMA